jgi:hemerythrin
MIDWSDAFVLGYPAMDKSHREFVDDLRALLTAPDDGLGAALDSFANHLAGHFAREEGWMSATEFPARECHADEHAAVMKSVGEVQALLRDTAQSSRRFLVARELALELERWFPAHTDYLDSALSHWMSRRAHGGAPVVLRRSAAVQAGDSPPGDATNPMGPSKGQGE